MQDKITTCLTFNNPSLYLEMFLSGPAIKTILPFSLTLSPVSWTAEDWEIVWTVHSVDRADSVDSVHSMDNVDSEDIEDSVDSVDSEDSEDSVDRSKRTVWTLNSVKSVDSVNSTQCPPYAIPDTTSTGLLLQFHAHHPERSRWCSLHTSPSSIYDSIYESIYGSIYGRIYESIYYSIYADSTPVPPVSRNVITNRHSVIRQFYR